MQTLGRRWLEAVSRAGSHGVSRESQCDEVERKKAFAMC